MEFSARTKYMIVVFLIAWAVAFGSVVLANFYENSSSLDDATRVLAYFTVAVEGLAFLAILYKWWNDRKK